MEHKTKNRVKKLRKVQSQFILRGTICTWLLDRRAGAGCCALISAPAQGGGTREACADVTTFFSAVRQKNRDVQIGEQVSSAVGVQMLLN